jgi:signal transduction histidine kinase/CheY-like chemotaxis protein
MYTLNSFHAAIVTGNPVDAELAVQLLNEDGIHATSCDSISNLCALSPAGLGCIVLAGDSLAESELHPLREMLQDQPAWSDMPLILVAADSAGLRLVIERIFPNTGNLTLLEQPLNPAMLVSAVRLSLRSRARQLEVRDLLAERDEALRMRNEFLAMLAHELRNPLAPMRNAVYLQKSMDIDDPAFEKTRDIFDRQITHMSRMVDDLLDVSRLERGKLQLQCERVDLNTLVTAAVDACLPLTQSHDHTVKINLAQQPLFVDADPVRIEQLLVNLITNAVKFTPEPGEIALETSSGNDIATVSVRDTGIGIAPAMLQSIFHAFTQDDRTLARTGGGLGVGLTIARRLAELHGGSLHAGSEGLNKGSTFTARFPLASTVAAKADDPSQPHSPQRRRVLIVEDNPDIRETLRMVLEIWGHEVTSADTGQEGLELARREHPDVALIDIGLPGMNGYEVARTIRTDRLQPQIKLVAITGYGQPDDRERTLKAGFDTHLLKPIDPQVLQKIIASV